MLAPGRGCSSEVLRLDTEEEAEPRGAGLRELERPAGLPLKENPLCSPAHCLSPRPAPRRAEETSGAWPAEFLSSFLASSCHVAPDHDISVPCCQCLGLRGMSVYPGPLAKKKWLPSACWHLPLPCLSSSFTCPGSEQSKTTGSRPGPGPQARACVSVRPAPPRVRYRLV